MKFRDQEVSLKLQARPLRILYLVASRQDITNAVTLYTHTWGGAANDILPVPANEHEAHLLNLTLEQINPDYIFTPVPFGELPDHTQRVLGRYPAMKYDIGENAILQQQQGPPVSLSGGKLPPAPIILERLYPNGLEKSIIVLPGEGGAETYEFAIDVQAGIYGEQYGDYLEQALAGNVLPAPNSPQELLETCFNLAYFHTPISVTMSEAISTLQVELSYSLWMADRDILCLFLDDGASLGVATAFWNSRKTGRENKLFLPKEAFLNDLQASVAIVIDKLPSLCGLFITTPLTPEDARLLQAQISTAFANAGKDVAVLIRYKGFEFHSPPISIHSGQQTFITRGLGQDQSVRFMPPAPFGHEGTDFEFGYDAEVQFISGRKPSLPPTPAASVLLSNDRERIERAERDPLWLRRSFTARPSVEGLTGKAQAGQEARFYIHSDDFIVSIHLREAGLQLKPNPHTRYARGVANRLGGIDQLYEFVYKGGVDVILALISHRAQQNGFLREQIVSFLENQRGMTSQQARATVDARLPGLLNSGLSRRGHPLHCPNCDLRDWYPIDAVEEFTECIGCAEPFQLPFKISFAYKPNELASRLIREGGHAVLMTAALFLRIENTGFLEFGGELFRSSEQNAFAEVDVFWITGPVFIIAECKSIQNIGEQELIQITESLKKTIEAARLIGAKAVVLGVVTETVIPKLFDAVADAARDTKGAGIGVHLALNGNLYLLGSRDITDPIAISLKHLLVYDESSVEENSVGELPAHGYL